jgi:NTP pyrophosphatase (non-canonical NTP hydrolase)
LEPLRSGGTIVARIPGTTFHDDDFAATGADKLEKAFILQREFMDLLVENDKLPEYPVDLSTKPGQRLIKETVWNMVEELAEASFTLKNRMHKLSDDSVVDFEHYREELGDAFAFLMEVCLLSGISATDLYEEYRRKNQVVRQRLQDGY